MRIEAGGGCGRSESGDPGRLAAGDGSGQSGIDKGGEVFGAGVGPEPEAPRIRAEDVKLIAKMMISRWAQQKEIE
jgi:hypothetical protein